MKKTSAFLISFLFLLCCAVLAVDLDAPGGKKVTIKSEILRGNEATFSAGQSGDPMDLLSKMDALDHVFAYNKQKNTDSPGFLLGANFGAWSALSISLELLKGKDYIRKSEYDLAYKFALDYFKDFRKLQRQLKISDDKLMETIGFKQPLMDNIHKWDYQTK